MILFVLSFYYHLIHPGDKPCGFFLFSNIQRDDKGFAHPEKIQKLVKNYSQFVSFPIYTWQEKGYTKEVM